VQQKSLAHAHHPPYWTQVCRSALRLLAIASMEVSQPVVCENGEDPNEKCPCLLQNNALGDGISWNIMEYHGMGYCFGRKMGSI